jgi:hypothetical protein
MHLPQILKRMFCPKREEVAGGWRRLDNEELHNLYASANITTMIKQRKVRWVRHVARIGATRNAYNNLFGQPEGKRPFRISGRK